MQKLSMQSSALHWLLPAALLALFCGANVLRADEASVEGSFIVNGNSVALPYVYVWREKKGFYEDDDPAWTILFVGRKLKATEIGDPVWDAAWIEIGVTESSEFSDGGPKLQVYSQSLRLAADSGGNMSGGNYPNIQLDGLETGGAVSGHVWHDEMQEFFDDRYRYDLTFNTAMSDPDAPIGEVLPAGGGEPGLAYLKWVETLQTGDIDQLLAIVPEELAAQLTSVPREEAEEQIDFMRSMTPSDVRILSGSSDGETAILKIEGELDGETVKAEITLTRMGEQWVPTKSSM